MGTRLDLGDGIIVPKPPDFDKLSPEDKNRRALELKQQATSDVEKFEASQPPVDYVDDITRSGAAGLGQGAIAVPGSIGDMQELAPRAGLATHNYFRKLLGYKPLDKPYELRIPGDPDLPKAQTSAELQEMASQNIPGLREILEYEPKSQAGRYTRAVTRQLPGAAIGPGGLIVKGASAVGAGLAGEGANQMLRGSRFEQWTPFVETLASVAGGVGSSRGATSLLTRRGLSEPAALQRMLGELEA